MSVPDVVREARRRNQHHRQSEYLADPIESPLHHSLCSVVTLDSMADSGSDDDEEQGQAFYAGGSERSGQQVLGPPKKNPIKDYVSEIFRSAQESGAEVVDPHSRHASQPGSSRGGGGGHMYGGSGYRLGMTDTDHTVLPAPVVAPSRPQPEVIIIKLWSNGLSINDGPLRPYDEPENQSFLNSIKKGEIPTELRKHGNAPVHVDLEDHRKEEYRAPKRNVSMFSGEGNKLGNPAPTVTGSQPSSVATSPTAAAATATAPATSPNENAVNEKKATEALKLDEGQPITMIQIRLADGSRVAGRFNHTHTVEDIRQFISVARPIYATQRFNLLTTFPSKELADGSVNVKDAGLLNAAVLQRMA